ncbi:MAG: response regulator, partial [Longicatena sp.]
MPSILLIEDEDNIRKIIAYDLKKANYDVCEVADGKEAIKLALEKEYDVLLIDWMLPHVSGIEIVEKLRAAKVNSIFIMVT